MFTLGLRLITCTSRNAFCLNDKRYRVPPPPIAFLRGVCGGGGGEDRDSAVITALISHKRASGSKSGICDILEFIVGCHLAQGFSPRSPVILSS